MSQKQKNSNTQEAPQTFTGASKKLVTEHHKEAARDRQARLAARPDDAVSENCRKKRGVRRRKAEFQAAFKSAKAAERKKMISPHDAGERQFGENAKPWHVRKEAS